MSMRNLGRQWTQSEVSFEAHRGFKQTPNVKSGLGMHWTGDVGLAKKFAGELGYNPEVHKSPRPHTIVHAQIPVSSVETNQQTLQKRGVYDAFSPVPGIRKLSETEKEVSVKSGAPINVTGITKFRGSVQAPKSRTRRYNPPRQMQA